MRPQDAIYRCTVVLSCRTEHGSNALCWRTGDICCPHSQNTHISPHCSTGCTKIPFWIQGCSNRCDCPFATAQPLLRKSFGYVDRRPGELQGNLEFKSILLWTLSGASKAKLEAPRGGCAMRRRIESRKQGLRSDRGRRPIFGMENIM